MSTKKALPDLTDFLGGLNTSANPMTKKPNEWSACQNVFVGKPYGFKTGVVEENHVAQTRPPMRLFFNSAFDVAVAGSPTEIKPLVGATQTAQDNQPNQWQTLFLGETQESWAINNAGHTNTPFNAAGLTKSDGNNIALQANTDILGGLTIQTTVTLPKPYTQGQIGNNTTKLWIDYEQLFRYQSNAGIAAQHVDWYAVGSMELRIGTDSGHYLSYTLPVGSSGSPPASTRTQGAIGTDLQTYGIFRSSFTLRNYNSIVGGLPFGYIVNNLVWCQIICVFNSTYLDGNGATQNITTPWTLSPHTGYNEFMAVDHVRLDVDYLGFFGDFTVGQAYRQVTLDSLDQSNQLSKATWTLGQGFYPERRLSIGNGSLGFESTVNASPIASATLAKPIDTTVSGFPTVLMLDTLVSGINTGGGLTYPTKVRIGSDAANYKEWDITPNSPVAAVNKVLFSSLPSTGSPNLAAISYIAIIISVPNGGSLQMYFNNLRWAPYTIGTGFSTQTGNIRDSFLYDPTDIGQSSRFLTSCGDALFIGTGLLSSSSWYVEGGFTNWSPSNPNLPQRFVSAMVTNPNFIATQTLNADVIQGASSIVLTGLPVNLTAGEQVVIDPNGVYPEINYVASTYVAGSATVPLTTALAQPHSSGATVTWENTAQPKNQVLLVNGVDGLYSVDIFTYPVPGGSTYQYPRFTKLAPEAYSTVIVHKGYACLSGDPNNPNRTVLAPISGLPNIPAQSFIELDTEGRVTAGDKITSLWSFEKYLLHIRKTDVWITYGDSINNFSTDPTSATRGALGQNHVCQAGRRLFFLAYDGVYEFAGLTTQKISDNVNNYFQTGDLTLMQSGFIFYNPIREILTCVLPLTGSYLLDPLTTSTQYIFTYSLQNQAWGLIYGSIPGLFQPVNPRYTVFSAVFYAGGGAAPSVYFSSTTMVEWDNVTDTEANIFQISMAPNGYGNFFQEKVFDKLYLWAKNFALANGYNTTGVLALGMGYNQFNSVVLAVVGQVTPDADGLLELMSPSGTWGKAARLNIVSGYSAWGTPIQFEMFGLSHWATQEL